MSDSREWRRSFPICLARWSARRLGDPAMCARYEEEWTAYLLDVPGNRRRLALAIGYVVCLPSLRSALQARKRTQERSADADQVSSRLISFVRPEFRTALVFAASGFAQASFFSRLPGLRDLLFIDLGGVGVALAALGVGTMISIVLAGPICRRYGTRHVVGASVVTMGVTLTCSAWVPVGLFLAVMLCQGLATGAWQASMNIQGVMVERRTGRHWMLVFHGWWTIGSVAGAGLGVVAARSGLGVAAHLTGIALVCVVACSVGLTAFRDERSLYGSGTASGRKSRFRGLGLIAALIAMGATVEGAAGDWLAIYLDDYHGISHASASAGYAQFIVAFAIGQLGAVYLYRTFGAAAAVRAGGILAALGVVLVVTPYLPIAFVGSWMWGLGISVVLPAALSAAGQKFDGSSNAVTAMLAVGFGGGVVGPILLGAIGTSAGLRFAILILVLPACAIALFAPAFRTRSTPHSPSKPATA